MAEANILQNNQKRGLLSDIKANRSLTELQKRIEKVYGAQKAIVAGYDARIGNFKSSAYRDVKYMEESFQAFKELNVIYEDLRNATQAQTDLRIIEKVENAGNVYKNSLMELNQLTKEIDKLVSDLISTGTDALKMVNELGKAGINGAENLADDSA